MNTAYTSAPLVFLVAPISFEPGGPDTMIGATVRVDAINEATKAKVAGTASVRSEASVQCTFAAGSLGVGQWSIQCWALNGGLTQVIHESLWTVKRGAF